MAFLGLPVMQTPRGYEVSTEMATTLFGLVAGVGGAIANLVAGGRLSDVTSDTIPLRTLAVPVGISIAASAGAAFLIPRDA